MRQCWAACLVVIVVCLLLEFERSEAKHGSHQNHHRKRGRKHHDHHHHHHHDHHSSHGSSDHHSGNSVTPASDALEIHTVKIGWLNVPQVVGCRCRHEGAICIKGPDGKPTCVKRHHLQESARLFKHYHEMKERAEEDLNEVDPPPYPAQKHSVLHGTPLHAPLHPPLRAPLRAPLHPHALQEDSPGSSPHSDVHMDQTRQHLQGRTEDSQAVKPVSADGCDNAAMEEMRRRLTSWFHLLHYKYRPHHHGNHHHPRSQRHLSVKKELREAGAEGRCRCLGSVMWEFRQLDADDSGSLNGSEVSAIDNNAMEPCLHPYLSSCDSNDDGEMRHTEWCCCFPHSDSESPCYARLDEIEPTKNTETYIPSCDGEGFYHREQCMGGPLQQSCWCVTPTGSEIPGTRTNGRAHCNKVDNQGHPRNKA